MFASFAVRAYMYVHLYLCAYHRVVTFVHVYARPDTRGNYGMERVLVQIKRSDGCA